MLEEVEQNQAHILSLLVDLAVVELFLHLFLENSWMFEVRKRRNSDVVGYLSRDQKWQAW